MFLRINSILPVGTNYKVLSIFGYRSNGVPGLEIKGLLQSNSIIREKLIYFSKLYGVKVPIRRFHLCIDLPKDVAKMKKELIDDRYFELPLLFLYWSLADVFQFHGLEDCFAIGRIDPDGKIKIPKISDMFLEHTANHYSHQMQKSMTFICGDEDHYPAIRTIGVNEILPQQQFISREL